MNFERLDAIKRMMNVPEDTEGIRLSTGEVIRPWDCLTENLSPVGISELADEEILSAYQRHLDWNCPEDHK